MSIFQKLVEVIGIKTRLHAIAMIIGLDKILFLIKAKMRIGGIKIPIKFMKGQLISPNP